MLLQLLVSVLVLVVSADPSALLALLAVPPSLPRRRSSKRVYWYELRAAGFPEKGWRASFRLSKPIFKYVANAIRSHVRFADCARTTRSTSVDKLLAVYLYATGAQVQLARVAQLMEVSPNTVVRAMHDIPIAIIELLGDNIAWPTGADKVRVKNAFADAGFPGAVGIIDATHIKIVPDTASRRNGSHYTFVDRKSQPSKVY